MTVSDIRHFMKISQVSGVDRYLFADPDGRVIAHNFKTYQSAGRMVALCAKNAQAIAGQRLEYLVFKRQNNQDLLIFPVGKYYLGVIKQSDIPDGEVTGNILAFIKSMPETMMN